MQRRDHHDWASETYVDEWVRRQQTEDPIRAERFQLMCDLFPFADDAPVTILDVGAGYGPVSAFILGRYPRATCIAQDGSVPMLDRAQTLVRTFGERFKTHYSDLSQTGWLPKQFAPFDAVVSSICLHNLRDFTRISQIYREIRAHVRAGGVFLNLDLVNAPTAELHQRYDIVTARRRHRDAATDERVETMVRSDGSSPAHATTGPFSATVDQHLAALTAAGFKDVDCFWKELRRALVGGYA
jgi:tRNA (cmo5U34)-methyltransferase